VLAAAQQPTDERLSAGELFAIHCGACHAVHGDGDGAAAASLFPRPLDLRADRFRLASTQNGVASAEYVAETIRRGIPGTAMPPLAHLGQDVIERLAHETLRLRREGVQQRLRTRFGDELDEDEIEALVDQQTLSGDAVAVPVIGPGADEAAERGREIYFQLGCQHCHGDDGRGAPHAPMYDPQGQLAPPRDLVRDPFKGGHDPEAIYRRLRIGMPGTLHPASPDLPEEQLVDLVQYVRSLSQEPKHAFTNYQRLQTALQRVRQSAAR
jgi:mono/diheme cytochrome c family protein